jgi:hypothetical protein
VREREVANPRFSFLDPKDIYYKYYRSLLPTTVRPISVLCFLYPPALLPCLYPLDMPFSPFSLSLTSIGIAGRS